MRVTYSTRVGKSDPSDKADLGALDSEELPMHLSGGDVWVGKDSSSGCVPQA